jgi:hypothetical protein
MSSPRESRLRIAVLGYVVRGPLGGTVWSNLQYLRGLARLGHDVHFASDPVLGGLLAAAYGGRP